MDEDEQCEFLIKCEPYYAKTEERIRKRLKQ